VSFEPFALGFMAIPAHDKAAKEKLSTAREAFFKKLRLRNEDHSTIEDYTADVIRSHLAQARALDFFRSGNPPAALEQADLAASFSRGIKETLNNLGSLIAECGLPDRSVRFFREALAIRADYQLARQNPVVVLRNGRKLEEAFREASFGARVDPSDAFFFEEATDLAVALKDGASLAFLCGARMKAVPSDPAPHRILGEWAIDIEHSPDLARAHFEAALAVDAGDERSRRKLSDLVSADKRPGEVAKIGTTTDTEDAGTTFAGLLPPKMVEVSRDEVKTGRAFRFRREADPSPVIGATELAGILGQMRMPGSFDPTIGIVPPERKFKPPVTLIEPVEQAGETQERER
jgi:hypothetical protein